MVSTLTGVTFPLLCSEAVTVTSNAVFVLALVGAEMETLDTFTSASPSIAVTELPPALSFEAVGSLTCSSSTATDAVTGKVWLEGVLQVTDQTAPLTVAAVNAGSDVFCMVCGSADDVVQSGGSDTVNVVSTFVGPYGPRFCTPADAVTLNATPTAFEGGLATVTVLTLMSEVALMPVFELPLALLLPPVGSLRWGWSMAAEALTEKPWLDELPHVTDQVAPLTVVGVDVGSDVSWIVSGLADVVVQSPGRVTVNVVSTFVGPKLPLLCSSAEAVTVKATPAALLAGEETETVLTLMSDVAVMPVLEMPLALLLPPIGSLTWSCSTATEALTGKVWLEGVEQLTDQVTPFTGLAVDVGSEVFSTACGFAEEVVQSDGRLSVNVVSAFVGP
jgi:hypothetical protein